MPDDYLPNVPRDTAQPLPAAYPPPPPSAPPPPPLSAPVPPAPRPRSRTGLVIALAAAVVLLGGTVVGLLLSRSSSSRTAVGTSASPTAAAPTGSASEPTASVAPTSSTAARPGSALQTYRNPRFGFSCTVPGTFTANAPPANGDGQQFVAPDDARTVTCSGINNVEGAGVEDEYDASVSAHLAAGDTVTYKQLVHQKKAPFATGYVVSGVSADDKLGYYEWTVWGPGSENTLAWAHFPLHVPLFEQQITSSYTAFRAGDVTTSH